MRQLAGPALLILVLSSTAALAAPPYHGYPYENEVTLSLGVFEPRGSSDLWRQNESEFTVSREDFDDAIVGARIGSSINNFVAFDVGASYYDGGVTSEDRNFVDAFNNPIRQDFRLRLLPVTVSLRIMPFGQFREGRRRSELQRVIPYFGFGGGAMLWKYREQGDFVDPSTVPATIFRARFRSRGIAPEYHGFAGVDVVMNPQVALFVEGKASRSKDDLSSDFQGFEKFDLSGYSLSLGTRIRF